MTLTLLPEFAAAFAIVMARIGTLVMLMPGVGDRSIPARLRLTFALLLTTLMVPLVRPMLPAINNSMELLVRLVVLEVLIGLMIGTSVRVTLAAMQLAGTVAAQQIGLSMSAAFDPNSGVQNPTIATFLILMATTMIFALDLHHLSIKGMHDSYEMVRPGTVPEVGDATAMIVKLFAGSFAVGVQIAMPFVVFAIIFNMGLGILARLMPQLQVFFVALPATILIGTLILLLTIGVMMNVFMTHLSGVLGQFVIR